MFETSASVPGSPLFGSEDRMSTWPWFCLNGGSGSPAAMAAADIAFGNLSKNKDNLISDSNTDSLSINRSWNNCSPHFLHSENNNNSRKSATQYGLDALGLFEERHPKTVPSSSLPCSPIGNTSTSSSPNIQNSCSAMDQPIAIAPLDGNARNRTFQVYLNKK